MRKKYKDYFITIGLEIHVALNTKRKLFSLTENNFECKSFSLLDCAIPGVLPVLNKEALELACIFGLATKSKINLYSEFERKHYFYPDLALGYQITQQHKPILGLGSIPIQINGENKNIIIEHSHLECDAAKSLHDLHQNYTAIDVSRGGTVLLEIVSTPCIHSPEEAKEYAKTIHSLVSILGICDGKMEEGSFRVDASISLSKKEDTLGTRVEIKNISSFNFLEVALNYEIERQYEILNKNDSIVMQTRLFDEQSVSTIAMRDKETVQDYRYMQDPDIPAIQLTDNFINEVNQKHFIDYFELISFYDKLLFAENFESDRLLDLLKTPIGFYLISLFKQKDLFPKENTNKLIKSLLFWLPEIMAKNKDVMFKLPLLSDFITIINSNLEAKEFKDVFSKWLYLNNTSILDFIPKENSEDINLISSIISDILIEFKSQVEDKKIPYEKKIQFIIGQCMKQLKGKIPASKLSIEIKKRILE